MEVISVSHGAWECGLGMGLGMRPGNGALECGLGMGLLHIIFIAGKIVL